MFQFQAFTPTRILAGLDSLQFVGDETARLGKRAMLVTGRKSMKSSGYRDRVRTLLKKAGVEAVVYDRVASNPTRESVNEGGKIAKEAKVDVVVGLGGGSALDVAKGIAVAASLKCDIWDIIAGRAIGRPVLPVVGVPSTAGTGSEVTKYAVISDERQRLKEGFASDFIIPKVAIIDPTLMSTPDKELTAKAGGDALAQAVEAFLTKRAHPYSDLLALESVRLCSKYLAKAVRDGKNLEARLWMGWASTLAGIAISYVDVVIGHHLSEAVGALHKTHHGETAALLLPYAMDFNFKETKARLVRIGEAMGVKVGELKSDDAAKAAIETIRKLLKRIGVPKRLRDLGVTTADIPAIMAILKTREADLREGNPHEISESSMQKFVEMAM